MEKKKFENPELIIIFFEGDLDTIGASDPYSGADQWEDPTEP